MTAVRASAGEAILVIDVGLTAVKAALVEPGGRIGTFARTFWPVAWEVEGGARVPSVPDIWPTVAGTVRQCVAAAPGTRVAVVVGTVAAQSGVSIDRDGRMFVLAPPPPLAPNAPDLAAPWGREGWARYGYGGTLMRYVRHARLHAPDRFARIVRTGPMHAYLTWRLTARWATDPASGTGEHHWPAGTASWTGLRQEAFPELVDGERIVGALTPGAAAALGLGPGIPVATGAHDGSCSSFGAGCYGVGDCALTLSTNFVPRPVTGAPVPGLFGYPIRPGAWAWVHGLSMSGRQIDRARAVLSAAAGGGDEAADLDAKALDAFRRDRPRPSLPYLAPDRVGEQDGRVHAALSQGWSADVVYLAAIVGCAEAVAARVREARAHGITPRRFAATGGMTRRPVVLAAIGRALGEAVAVAHPEAGVLGAAALAAAAIGWHQTPEAALERWRRDGPADSGADAALPRDNGGVGGGSQVRGCG